MDRTDMAKNLRAEAARIMEAAQNEAGKYIEAANALEGRPSTNGISNARTLAEIVTELAGKTCKEKLEDFLRRNGPMPRGEIIRKCGLNGNTVGYLLTKKNFNRDDDGRWSPK